MDSIFLLVPIVIFFVACAVKLFFWAVNSGQYDDLETEGRRILFDEDEPRRPKEGEQSRCSSGEDDAGESR
ncbi:cbb3-type cytochrome oxidase assembly protein CcoS [Microbulbifer hydrolyticus]|uniref:Cbb3-type cytochrome oxidase assembly protein CcoS n=1 Tax=Microbulbifer hydrolyticus TaxID=48074 RepID=A0A6P1T9Q9_9GAMM|nr:cbb3-type cytochrome oxidase assembly protein CcoS [Microbulbifer hydrolyticus]MBB5213276.1 cbb3-type cytochrome oxidase maturation protein [Microbulbifer hydrolyticus]QHQ38561.1 cbb3-type cytochrome oxidase assembly protein CcoS [Microbulbifer hydrolyticus]